MGTVPSLVLLLPILSGRVLTRAVQYSAEFLTRTLCTSPEFLCTAVPSPACCPANAVLQTLAALVFADIPLCFLNSEGLPRSTRVLWPSANAGAIVGLSLSDSHLLGDTASSSNVHVLKTIVLCIYVVISWCVFFNCCFRQRDKSRRCSILA